MEESEVVQGKPWKNVAFRSTFKEADLVRSEHLQEEGVQVKVKWLPSMNKFVIKARRDPLLEATDKLVTKNKKKRKK